MKVLAVLAALLVGASVVSASNIPTTVVPTDARGLWVIHTFTHIYGASDTLIYGEVADTETLSMNASHATFAAPTDAISGWFTFQVPDESNLTTLRFQFKEIDSASLPATAVSYTWGDAFDVHVGGYYKLIPFQVGAWDSVRIWGDGAAADTVTIYSWTEHNDR